MDPDHRRPSRTHRQDDRGRHPRRVSQIQKAIAAEQGYDLTDRLQRGRAAVAADKAIERWEGREREDPPPVPAKPIEELLRKVYRHNEALRAMEEEMAA
jgi:hypothetical protein